MLKFATEYWPDTHSRVEFIPTSKPPDLPVTAVKIYVFQDDRLLLANISGRGWDLPGGHIEPGEAPEQAITRELREEAGAHAERFELIGYLKITNEHENERNRMYPKISCILIYKGYDVLIDAGHTFELEASECKFVPIDQLPQVHHDWSEAKAQIVRFASNFGRL